MVTLKFLGMLGAAAAVAVLGSVTACTTDDGDPGASTGGSNSGTGGGASTGGSANGTSTGGASATGTACASPVPLEAGKGGITDFDAYDGKAIASWTFPLNGDSTSVLGGPFGYGDADGDKPETFEMGPGHDSMYALRIADTLAETYGGGMGLWQSACVNASNFSGLSFWARGNTPEGKSTLTLMMGDTQPSVPAKADDKIGTCSGDAMTCVHPTFVFPVTDEWTEIEIPWASFTAGNAAGVLVKPDGKNIFQLQFGVGLVWVPDAAGVYMPTPAPYELSVDTLAFY